MKTKLVLLSLVLGLGSVCVADPVSNTPLISVTGTAVTEVRPDVLLWAVEVRNTGLELGKVAERHAKLSAAVLALLKEQGIEDKLVQTAEMEFGANRVYRHNEYVEEGYYASTVVSFKLTDLGKYKALWMKLANSDGVSVKSVSFDHSKRLEITRETRTKALHVARDKAIAMAEALESKVGEVLSIAEDQTVASWYSANNSILNSSTQSVQQGAGDDEGGGGVAPGTIPVRVKVLVSFRLLNAGK